MKNHRSDQNFLIELRDRINQLERKYDQQFKSVFDAIKNIIEPITQPKQIGFITNSDTKTSAKKPQSQNRKTALG